MAESPCCTVHMHQALLEQIELDENIVHWLRELPALDDSTGP